MARPRPRRYIPVIAASAACSRVSVSPAMSSIGPDNRLNVTGLDRLDRQVSLDDLRRQPGGAQDVADVVSMPAADAQAASTTDTGEDVLNAAAWGDVAPGQRTLDGDLGLEGRLGALDLAQAADSAVDAVLGAFG
jgi:hypothetical protein